MQEDLSVQRHQFEDCIRPWMFSFFFFFFPIKDPHGLVSEARERFSYPKKKRKKVKDLGRMEGVDRAQYNSLLGAFNMDSFFFWDLSRAAVSHCGVLSIDAERFHVNGR